MGAFWVRFNAGGRKAKALRAFNTVVYSLGLGIPFILSAVLLQNLKSVFGIIKRNYRIINLVSGLFLVLVGILMATGLMGRFLALLSF